MSSTSALYYFAIFFLYHYSKLAIKVLLFLKSLKFHYLSTTLCRIITFWSSIPLVSIFILNWLFTLVALLNVISADPRVFFKASNTCSVEMGLLATACFKFCYNSRDYLATYSGFPYRGVSISKCNAWYNFFLLLDSSWSMESFLIVFEF